MTPELEAAIEREYALRDLVHNLCHSVEFWHREAYVHLKEKDAWFSGHVVRDRELIAKVRATFPLPTKDD